MRALVTGANGHLGFNLVQALLARGDEVRAGVRSVADVGKCEALRALPGVEVVGADLGQPAQLRAAMDGIDTLFHVAAVFATTEPGRDAEILRTAIEGTEASLRAARDAKLRRVVMTSSMVTLPFTAPGAPPATEADWNDDLRVTYFRAKVEAERLAWQLARELKLDLVTVPRGGLIGPGFRPDPASRRAEPPPLRHPSHRHARSGPQRRQRQGLERQQRPREGRTRLDAKGPV